MKIASIPTRAPKSSPIVELGDLVEFRRGLTYKKSDEVESSSIGVLRANNVDLTSGRLDLSDIRYLSDDVVVPQARKLVAESLLVCTASGSRAHLGKMAHVSTTLDYAFGGFMGLLVPKEDVSARYIWYYSRSDAYRDYLNALAPGANINNLRFDDLATLEIPLPPLDEQKRIVAVLDQAFAAIDRARANIEKNIQNVNELFVEGLETVVIRHSHASASTTLSEVCTFENGDRGVNYPGRKAYAPKGVAFINAGHLDDGVIDWASMNFIPEEIFNRLSKGKVRKGDILFCLRGSLGKFAKVDHSDTGAIASSLVILRTGSRLAADFLSIYFRTKHSRKMIEKYAGGAAQPNLSAGDLKKFTITLPRVEDQYLAIAEFQQLQANMNQVREAYSYALVELAVLRQSLLQAAFSGQLS